VRALLSNRVTIASSPFPPRASFVHARIRPAAVVAPAAARRLLGDVCDHMRAVHEVAAPGAKRPCRAQPHRGEPRTSSCHGSRGGAPGRCALALRHKRASSGADAASGSATGSRSSEALGANRLQHELQAPRCGRSRYRPCCEAVTPPWPLKASPGHAHRQACDRIRPKGAVHLSGAGGRAFGPLCARRSHRSHDRICVLARAGLASTSATKRSCTDRQLLATGEKG
jgi:hypothetical protein